jgi:hypothetical protein
MTTRQARFRAKPQARQTPIMPGRGILLQRKCACGGALGPSGECEECRKKRLQRKVAQPSILNHQHSEVPRIVQEVLRSTGQPLEPETRAFVEPRFGHKFSRVRVHSNTTRARRLDVTGTAEMPPTAETSSEPSVQPADDPYCLHMRPGEGPERCEFTPNQQSTLSFVHYAARTLTSQALVNLSRGDAYMTTLAQRIFHAPDPDMNQITMTTSQILDNLRSKPIVCGTCADEDCYTAGVVAHVTEDLSTVVLCQRFFRTSATQMRRTLIHEAGHAAGVDSSLGNVPETYCAEGSEGCVDPCSNLTGDLTQNVDAWARFIECAAYSG